MLLSISSSTQIERVLAGVRFVCRQRYKHRGTARGSYALLWPLRKKPFFTNKDKDEREGSREER
jgi:hypothetical protein